ASYPAARALCALTTLKYSDKITLKHSDAASCIARVAGEESHAVNCFLVLPLLAAYAERVLFDDRFPKDFIENFACTNALCSASATLQLLAKFCLRARDAVSDGLFADGPTGQQRYCNSEMARRRRYSRTSCVVCSSIDAARKLFFNCSAAFVATRKMPKEARKFLKRPEAQEIYAEISPRTNSHRYRCHFGQSCFRQGANDAPQFGDHRACLCGLRRRRRNSRQLHGRWEDRVCGRFRGCDRSGRRRTRSCAGDPIPEYERAPQIGELWRRGPAGRCKRPILVRGQCQEICIS